MKRLLVLTLALLPALANAGQITMTNPQEEQILSNPAFQQKMALAIVAGIDQFFGQAAKMRGEQ